MCAAAAAAAAAGSRTAASAVVWASLWVLVASLQKIQFPAAKPFPSPSPRSSPCPTPAAEIQCISPQIVQLRRVQEQQPTSCCSTSSSPAAPRKTPVGTRRNACISSSGCWSDTPKLPLLRVSGVGQRATREGTKGSTS